MTWNAAGCSFECSYTRWHSSCCLVTGDWTMELHPHTHCVTSCWGIALNFDETKTLADKHHNSTSYMQTACKLTHSHPCSAAPDSTGNSIALIKRLAPTTSITQQSILLNKQSSVDPTHSLLPFWPHVCWQSSLFNRASQSCTMHCHVPARALGWIN